MQPRSSTRRTSMGVLTKRSWLSIPSTTSIFTLANASTNSSNEPMSELNERTAIFAERPCSITTDFAGAHPLFGDVAKLEDDGVAAAGLDVSLTLTRSPSTIPSGALSITRSSGDSPDAISIVLPRSRPIVIDFQKDAIIRADGGDAQAALIEDDRAGGYDQHVVSVADV